MSMIQVGNIDVPDEPKLVRGTYDVKCVSVEGFGENPEKPNRMNLAFEVIEGPIMDDGETESAGKRIFDSHYSNYSDHKDGGRFAKRQLKNALQAFEVDADLEEGLFDSEDFIGKEGTIRGNVKPDQNGELRFNVTGYIKQ